MLRLIILFKKRRTKVERFKRLKMKITQREN